MGILDVIDNFLIFILRKDKGAAKRYVDNHPELKGKQKEITKRFKELGREWNKLDYRDVISGEKTKMDNPPKK